MPNDENYFAIACEIARYFVDRSVIIKHKRSNNGKLHSSIAFKKPLNIPSNLFESYDSAYELMLRCKYAISTPNSTICAEAIQYKLITYVWDPAENLDYSYYRHFPELCVSSAKEIISNITTLESGKAIYPRHKFSELVNLSETPIFDIVRGDIRR